MMDCNKEEAVRAKELAEKKMVNKDFVGARKVALRAQQLYPDLDNISQMLTVCDVHCSAEQKVLGSEMNWYAILQIEQITDEASIKKQYRKLALLLHPDKNKFAGAEAAFKLIGEAQRVLSDPGKRAAFDVKHRASVRTAAARQPQQPRCRNTYVTKDPGVNNSYVNSSPIPQFTTMNPHQRQQQQQQQQREPMFSNGRQTFWTVCPFCNIRYQYYKDVVNRALRCQSCLKTFFAYDLDGQGVPPSSTQSQFSQEKVVLNQGSHRTGPQVTVGNSSSGMGFQGNAKMSEPFIKIDRTFLDRQSKIKKDESPHASSGDRKDRNGETKFQTEKPKTSRKRGRKKEESSESCDTGDSSKSEDYESLGEVGRVAEQDSGLNGGRYPRRSSRQRQKVSYNEDLSDDDDSVRPPKRPKGSGLSNTAEDQSEAPVNEDCRTSGSTNDVASFPAVFSEYKKGGKQKGNLYTEENSPNGRDKAEEHKRKGKEAVTEDKKEGTDVGNSRSTTNSDPEFFNVPDPDFYDFDKDRREECFAVNQMWAIYDDGDGMPRFYAQIRKVFSPGFKVRIIWFEPYPHNLEETNWSNGELPLACGHYKHGKSMITDKLGMFSHLVFLEKVPNGNFYKLHPQRGEIWALFKNWSIKWSDDPDNHRNYEFEFVEVLSDYSEGSGISVAHLVKLRGFVSLFRLKKSTVSFWIPPNELLRFSHRIPSYRTTGSEREDVPEGYFELDPASLPPKLEDLVDSEDLKINIKTLDAKINGSCSKSLDNERPSMLEKCINPGERDSPNRNSKSRKDSLRKLGGSCKSDHQKRVSECAINENHHPSEGTKGSTSGGGAENSGNCVTEDPSPAQPSLEPCEIPEALFYDFAMDRTEDKFEPGQIWALYCDLDGLPKYYARINKVNLAPHFKLNITWLEPYPPPGSIQWLDDAMPICCGRFKIAVDQKDVYVSASSFSHLAGANPSGKKKYEIYPRKGEVWALYKNFNSEWTHSDLENCKYDMVEVLEGNDLTVKVLVLGQVDGHETIFRAQRAGKSVVTMEIPMIELIRFSHKVPAFLLTEQLDGTLRGCWELDPQSTPVSLFRLN